MDRYLSVTPRADTVTELGHGCQVVLKDLREHRQLIDDAVQEGLDIGLICRPPIQMGGRQLRQQRDIGFFAADMRIPGYRYARQMAPSKPMGPHLRALLDLVNRLYGADYNAILFNRYPGKGERWGDGTVCDGNSAIGEHGDDETGLHPCVCTGPCDPACPGHIGVVAISVGAERTFRVKDIATRQTHDFPTKPHFALQMRGREFQRRFLHSVPARKRVTTTRISLTFRHHHVPPA